MDEGAGRFLALEHFPRIHDAPGIQSTLDGVHCSELSGTLVVGKFFSLQPADPVFGTDTAAVARYQVVDNPIDGRCVADERIGIALGGCGDVEMQIAIAEVTIDNKAGSRGQLPHKRGSFLDEGGQRADHHRHVVLDAGSFLSLGFRNLLADPPEHLSLRFSLPIPCSALILPR